MVTTLRCDSIKTSLMSSVSEKHLRKADAFCFCHLTAVVLKKVVDDLPKF